MIDQPGRVNDLTRGEQLVRAPRSVIAPLVIYVITEITEEGTAVCYPMDEYGSADTSQPSVSVSVLQV